MKKFFTSFLVALIFCLSDCINTLNSSEQIDVPTQNSPSVPPQQTPTLPTPILPEPEEEFEEEKKNKKYYLKSKVDGLRVRSNSNTSSAVLGYLDKGDLVELIDKKSNFYETKFKEQTAYIHADYCESFEIEYSNEKVEKAIDVGSTLLGHPYVWGSQRYHWGNGKLNTNFIKGEFDCSALVQYVYYVSNEVILDVTSRAQSLNGREVQKSQLQRGDLMFFTNASRKDKAGIERIGHVGIYFGNNYILHTASDHAVIEPISSLRWSYFICARRVV